jgi:hypothetical protein
VPIAGHDDADRVQPGLFVFLDVRQAGRLRTEQEYQQAAVGKRVHEWHGDQGFGETIAQPARSIRSREPRHGASRVVRQI